MCKLNASPAASPHLRTRLVMMLLSVSVCSKSCAAHKICRVVRATGSFVFRHERVLAQRARPCDVPSLVAARRRQRLGCFAFLDPCKQRLQLSRGSWARAATAVRNTRRQKQTNKLRGLLRTSHLLLDPLVVVDRSVGGDELVGPPVPHNRLAAPIAKLSQVWVIGSNHRPVLLERLIPEPLIGCGGDCVPVKLRILREEVFQPVYGECERLWL